LAQISFDWRKLAVKSPNSIRAPIYPTAINLQLWARFSPPLPFWLTAIAALASVALVWTKFKAPAANGPAANGDQE
jgi:hypothetical protein